MIKTDHEGLGPGIIPDTLDRNIYEEVLRVNTHDSCEMAKRLAKEEGLLVGISSGANVLDALEIAKRPENAGKLIVTCLPSFGERYLSTCLYNDVRDDCEKMSVTSLDDDKEYLKPALGL
ncbi:Protein CYSL-2 [Aphelenchoides avenae]|nr:Protein CYSL-2 [Aphelenchus avenae]